jgi:hypothetical protein
MTYFLNLVYADSLVTQGLPVIGPMLPVDMIDPTCKIVKYQLFDELFVQKFLTFFFDTKSKTIENMQYYTVPSSKKLALMQTLNAQMQEINAIKPIFKPELFLETVSLTKLHEIHLCFELAAYQCEDLVLADMLEKVNFLVHSLEPTGLYSYFTQVTTALRRGELGIELTTDDYAQFKIPLPGQLFIDNNILGKNMFLAFKSRDFSLLEKGLTRQQSHIASAFQISYKYHTNSGNEFKYWVAKNKESLSKHYSLEEPSFALGNLILGSPVDPELNSIAGWFDKIFNTHKKLVCCYATDHNNNITHSF